MHCSSYNSSIIDRKISVSLYFRLDCTSAARKFENTRGFYSNRFVDYANRFFSGKNAAFFNLYILCLNRI